MFLRKIFLRNWRYYLMLLVFPFLYNHIGYGKIIQHQVLSWGFIILYFCMFFLMLGTLFWLSYVVKARNRDVGSEGASNGVFQRLYYPICIAPGIVALLIFVAGSFFANPQLPDILYYNAKYRFWVYALVVGYFAYWRLQRARRERSSVQKSEDSDMLEIVEAEVFPIANTASQMYIVAANRSEVEEMIKDAIAPIVQGIIAQNTLAVSESTLENVDDFYVLYRRLIVCQKAPVYNALGAVRFFDIVLVRLRSKGGDIYLLDGTCISCSNIQETLTSLDLLQWMVRIHKSCMVNMMHVNFNHYKEGGHLLLQSDTMARMMENGLKKMDIMNLLQFGPNIGVANVDQFITDRANLRYEVWDVFVPIKKKNSPDQ